MHHTKDSLRQQFDALLTAIEGSADTAPLLQIVGECLSLACFLRDKNLDYGNSALTEDDTFARGVRPSVAIRIRMADKLKRLRSGSTIIQEDTLRDLAGYIMLLRVAEEMESATATPTRVSPPPQVDTRTIKVPHPRLGTIRQKQDTPTRGTCLCANAGKQYNPDCPMHGPEQSGPAAPTVAPTCTCAYSTKSSVSSRTPAADCPVHPILDTWSRHRFVDVPSCPIHGEGCDCASK